MDTTRINNAKEAVKAALKWSDDDYALHLFDNGVEYLHFFTGDHDEKNSFFTEYSQEEIFWNWWKRQYLLLDEVFLAKLPLCHSTSLQQLINFYDFLHYSCAFQIDEVVFKKLFDDSARWVGQIIHKKTNQ